MHLDPTEQERLFVFAAAELARRNRADGALLSAPEAIAVICDEMHRAARLGGSYAEVAQAGRLAVAPAEVIDGVAEVVPEVRLEVLLDEGSRLVVLANPLGEPARPGSVLSPEPVELNAGRTRLALSVRNTSTRPVRVSSHYPFWKANPRLEFDREAAEGHRLDLPAGDSLRWAPGETHEVELVPYWGEARP